MPTRLFSYKDEIQKVCSKRAIKSSTTIFGVTYANGKSGNHDEERYVIACSSTGHICVWDTMANITMLKGEEEKDEDNQEENNQERIPACHNPTFKFEVCNGILYDVQFINNTTNSSLNSILIACGAFGIFVYNWNDILEAVINQSLPEKKSPSLPHSIQPISIMRPYPSSSLVPTEVNRISFDSTNGYLYGACGDYFGGYIWDINTSKLLGHLQVNSNKKRKTVKTTTRHQRRDFTKDPYSPSYLHTIKTLTSTTAADAIPSNHLVMTGDDNGEIGLWNGKEQKLIELINMKSTLMKSDDISTPSNLRNASCWVSAIDIDDTCQLSVIGGGMDHYSTSSTNSNGSKLDNGYLALLNIQTRTLTSCNTTKETINDVAFHSCLDKIVSVGNSGIVSFWNETDFTKERSECAWVTSPSAFSIAIQKTNGGMMAVGGVGNVLDCYSHFGYRSSTLKFNGS